MSGRKKNLQLLNIPGHFFSLFGHRTSGQTVIKWVNTAVLLNAYSVRGNIILMCKSCHVRHDTHRQHINTYKQPQHWMNYNVWGIYVTYLTEVTLTLSTAILLTLLSKARTNGCFTEQTQTHTLAQADTEAMTHGHAYKFAHWNKLHKTNPHLFLFQPPVPTYNYVRPFQASLWEMHLSVIANGAQCRHMRVCVCNVCVIMCLHAWKSERKEP